MPDCSACGADNPELEVKCARCGTSLATTGAQRLLGSVVLGQYEIVDIIGQGGMSVVYRARHTLTEQEVALKVLPPELAAHAQVKSRFLEEARALAQLDHPNIVHLYNFGQENGSFVLAMQFVRGRTCERLILEAGRLDWRRAVAIANDVLRALDFAHGRGVVHRDMKPSNILVRDEDGVATVMDFGIAKMGTSARLTATGQTMGTVRYMSPEQVRGQSVDGRSDLYSLGIALYEMIVGDTPYDGETHFEIMTKHLSELPAPPRELGVDVPAAVEAVILRALQKKPDERFQSARDFSRALDEAQSAPERAPLTTIRTPAAELPAAARRGATEPAASSLTDATGTPGELTDLIHAPRARALRRAGIAALAVVAAGVVVVMATRRGGQRAGVAPDAATQAVRPPEAPAWPPPFLLPGLTPAVDQAFPADELRVLSARPRDVEPVRAAGVEARARFAALLARRGAPAPPARLPLNVVIVPGRDFCDRRLYENGEVPLDCNGAESWYRPAERTLYVADDDRLLGESLPYGVALQTCLHARVAGCEDALEAFDAELAKAHPLR